MTIIGGKPLSLNDFEAVLFKGQQIELDSAGVQRVRDSFEFLQHFSKNKVIYGINTGFGKLASVRIEAADLETLQRNIVLSHAAGVGKPMPVPVVRLMMALKLGSLAQGASGVQPATVLAPMAVHCSVLAS